MAWRRSTTERTFTTQTQYQGVLQEIKAFFDSCSAEGADFPWTVASFAWDTPSANRGYVVLKRKDASAGRIYIAATPTADQNTTNYLGQGLNTSAGLTIGYDRTATVDTPTQAPTAGAPFGGTWRSNWMGASYLLSALGGTAFRLRAYTETAPDLFVLQMMTTDVSAAMYAVGNFVHNMHTGLGQLGQIVCTNIVAGTTAAAAGIIEATAPVVSQNTSSDRRACTWDATNGWQRLSRITTIESQNTLTNLNTAFAQADGQRYYVPIYCLGHLGEATQLQKIFRLKRMGFGEFRSRVASQLLDNNATPRGWYLGYHQTQGSDQFGLSLLNDDFA